jgi:hypothetical protein
MMLRSKCWAAWLVADLIVVGCSCAADGSAVRVDDCHSTEEGCASDAPIEVWDALAVESGFETMPENFFRFGDFACTYTPVQPPRTIDGLVEYVTLVLRGKIASIVPARQRPVNGMAQYDVYMNVQVDEVLKGEYGSDHLFVNMLCAHGGKVAGLMRTIPTEEFVFFLGGPHEGDFPTEFFSLAFHGLGIVGESEDGLAYMHSWSFETERPSLAAYRSLDDLAATIRDSQ